MNKYPDTPTISGICFEIFSLVLTENWDELKGEWIWCAPRWHIVFNVLFCKKSYFKTGNLIKWLVGIGFFFLHCPSPPARKRSHGTSSPHLVPAHAGRIMDGDQNTYKAKFTAAPHTEHGLCIRCLSSNTECQKQQNKTHSKLPWSIPSPNGFYSCQTYCRGSADGSRATSINTNDDERAELMKFHNDLIEMWKQERGFMCSVFMRLEGKQWLQMNILNLLSVYPLKTISWKSCHMPDLWMKWKRLELKLIAGVWLWCNACTLRQRKAVKANPHSHKGALSRLISVVSV